MRAVRGICASHWTGLLHRKVEICVREAARIPSASDGDAPGASRCRGELGPGVSGALQRTLEKSQVLSGCDRWLSARTGIVLEPGKGVRWGADGGCLGAGEVAAFVPGGSTGPGALETGGEKGSRFPVHAPAKWQDLSGGSDSAAHRSGSGCSRTGTTIAQSRRASSRDPGPETASSALVLRRRGAGRLPWTAVLAGLSFPSSCSNRTASLPRTRGFT